MLERVLNVEGAVTPFCHFDWCFKNLSGVLLDQTKDGPASCITIVAHQMLLRSPPAQALPHRCVPQQRVFQDT